MIKCLSARIDFHFGIGGSGGYRYRMDWDVAERRVAEILGVITGESNRNSHRRNRRSERQRPEQTSHRRLLHVVLELSVAMDRISLPGHLQVVRTSSLEPIIHMLGSSRILGHHPDSFPTTGFEQCLVPARGRHDDDG